MVVHKLILYGKTCIHAYMLSLRLLVSLFLCVCVGGWESPVPFSYFFFPVNEGGHLSLYTQWHLSLFFFRNLNEGSWCDGDAGPCVMKTARMLRAIVAIFAVAVVLVDD